MPTPDRLESPGADGRVLGGRVLGAVTAFAAAAVVLVATFLPVLTGDGESVGFFDCEGLPGCAWLALPQVVAVAVFAVLGAQVVARRARRAVGPGMVVAGALTVSVTLGWAAFVASQRDLPVSLGPGPIVGMIGGVIGVAAGLTLVTMRPTGAPAESLPASPVTVGAAAWRAVPGLVGAVGVGVAAFIPYAQFSEGEDTSIANCGVAGCGWFTLEPVALAIGVIVLALLVMIGLIGPRVAALMFGIGGVWGCLLYLGFVGYSLAITGSDAFGPDAKNKAGGWIGLAGAVLVLVASVLFLTVRARRPSDDRLVDEGPPPPAPSPVEGDERPSPA